MNILEKWEKYHFNEILKELEAEKIDLIPKNISKIIIETSFKIRSRKHPNKCPYYQSNTSCHPEIKGLSCFLCACPNYDSSIQEGGCKINSKKGKFTYHKNLPLGRVWDCSDCTINHSPKEIKNYLTKNLNKLKNI